MKVDQYKAFNLSICNLCRQISETLLIRLDRKIIYRWWHEIKHMMLRYTFTKYIRKIVQVFFRLVDTSCPSWRMWRWRSCIKLSIIGVSLIVTLRNLEFENLQRSHQQNQLKSLLLAHRDIIELMTFIYKMFSSDGPEVCGSVVSHSFTLVG